MPDLHVLISPDEALSHQCASRLSASLTSPVILRATGLEQSFQALEELRERPEVEHIILLLPWSVSLSEWCARWQHQQGHRPVGAHRLHWLGVCLRAERLEMHLRTSERVDDTSWAERVVETIETATTIILNTKSPEAVTLCRALNPRGTFQLLESVRAPKRPQVQQPSAWTALINEAPPKPQPGVQFFTFTARRPFDKDRLSAWLREPLDGLVRVGGFLWVADFPHIVARLSIAGAHRSWEPAGTWWIGIKRSHWPTDPKKLARIQAQWHPDFGDRLQALGCVGIGCDPVQVQESLTACLLRDEELDGSWKNAAMVPNPFP
jgi:hypothetical protein